MEWITYLGLVLQAVNMAEVLFKDIKGAGTVKKSTVMAVAQGAATTMGVVSTGGQKQTWSVLAPATDQIVEGFVKIINLGATAITGKEIISDDTKSAADTARG